MTLGKQIQKAEVKLEKYFKAHVRVNALAHLLIGAGIGVLITYPVVAAHPMRWGVGLVTAGVVVHLYPLLAE